MAANSTPNPTRSDSIDRAGGTLVLSQSDVTRLLDPAACIEAVEAAFRLLAEGRSLHPGVLSVHAPGGAFHIKAAGLPLGRLYFVAKTNANFPDNPAQRQLPTIQGVLVLLDGTNGRPLAVMDSMSLTAQRTAAATAVAAKHLAGANAETAMLIGCGLQAAAQIHALHLVRPLRRLFVADLDIGRAGRLAAAMAAELGIDARPAPAELRQCLAQSQIVVTCTTSGAPILGPGDVAPGTFIAAVGADNPEKNEIAPALLAASAVITDVTSQCAEIGDLRHAIDAGAMAVADVRAELGQVIAGLKPGRIDPGETVVFDSTGVAVQDVAAAAVVYERALNEGAGLRIDLAS